MKRTLLILSFLFLTIKGFSLTGGYDYYIFYTAEGKPYVELYYWVEGRTIQYTNLDNSKKQGELEVSVLISMQDTSKIFSFEKLRLKTLEFNISDSLPSDVYDVKRIMIPDGISYLEISIKDVNSSSGGGFSNKDTLTAINGATSPLFVSNIQLIDFVLPTENENMFSKGGYDILPSHSTYFSSAQEKIVFYTEIHNAEKTLNPGGKYIVNCYLENISTGLILESFITRKRLKAEPFTVLLSEFPIKDLSPGAYNFVVEVRDSLNQFKAKSFIPIDRENLHVAITEDSYKTISIDKTWADALPQDSLEEYLHSLRPICEGSEYQFVKNAIKENDPRTMRQLLYAFWTNRYPDDAAHPYNSYSEFKSYANLVYYVNEAFGTLLAKGYLTERGRVFLKYGAPNSISQRYYEPSAFPYEIWNYYKLNSQTRVKFVFYSEDIVTNDFRLLHSDLRGEIQNRQWDLILHSRNNTYKGDDNNMSPNYGNWSQDLYNNPR